MRDDLAARNGHGPARRTTPAEALGIIGTAPSLLAAIDTAEHVAATDIPVLIVGETGTGKELLARYIHQRSGRSGSLVDVDCGAIPEHLIESQLFGHRRGAFTGAIEAVDGLIRSADHGTLFLDELGNLHVDGQVRLLRVLETGEVRRIGDTRARRVDFRVVASAQSDLGHLVESGRFREDLTQRIAGIVIRLPSLDERGGDVGVLASYFAHATGARVHEEAISLLADRTWPGNVRELRWTLTRAAVFAMDSLIDVRALEAALQAGAGSLRSESSGNGAAWTQELRAVCRRHSGDPRRIAEALGIGRSTLYRRLKKAGLDLGSFRRAR